MKIKSKAKKATIKITKVGKPQLGVSRYIAPTKVPPPPPAIAKRPPPPPPPREPLPANSVLNQLSEHTPPRATHVEYSRPATDKDPGLTIVVPIGAYGDFRSFTTGKVRYGYLRYHDDFMSLEPEVAAAAEADAGIPAPPKLVQPKVPGPKREGVCAFIDERIMEGKRTPEQILEIVLAKFPGRDAKATLATIRTRPSHIKAKGLVPPAFAK
jgi:hypothetical protein